MNHSILALGAGLALSILGALSGFTGTDHAGHDHSTHSPAFERQLERNVMNLDVTAEEFATPSEVPMSSEDEIIIWNPVSGSVSSGCVFSGCFGSGCAGSGCGGSGCLGSGCGASACGGSACGASGCAGSGCGLSGCVGSLCGLSGCVGSACTQSGCVGSGCLVSGCRYSVCIVSGCKASYCVGSMCKDSVCVGSVGCKKDCLKKAQVAFADNPEYGQEYSWWVAYGRGANPGGWVPYLMLDPVTAEAYELPAGAYHEADEDTFVYVAQASGKVIPLEDLTRLDTGDYVYLDEETGEYAVAIEVAPFILTMVDENGDEQKLAVYENPLTHEFFDPTTGETLELDPELVAPFIEAYGQGGDEEPVFEPTEPVATAK